MIGKLDWLLRRAKAIQQTDGILALPRRTISFALDPIFWRRTYFLYDIQLGRCLELDEADFKPDIQDFSFKIVLSHEEADKLESEGFMFRLYPTFDNTKLKYYSKLLDSGAIACCGFAGHDLAVIQWIIPSRETMHKVTYYRTKIDFSNGELFCQGAWSNPKYRRKGLYKYNIYFNRDPFLLNKGIKTVKGTAWDLNDKGNAILKSIGGKRYAKAKVTRFLWWKLWEGETPLHTTDQ